MKIRLTILLLITLLIPAGIAYAGNEDSVRELFYQGNIYYSDNELQQAINSYEMALSYGYESSALYYNLGNAYFKNGELGRAIVNYLRAERLSPNDPDTRSNLAYAKSLIKGGVINLRKPLPVQFFMNIMGLVSLNRITYISIILYLLLCAAVILAVWLKRLRKALSIASLILMIIFVVSALAFSVKFNEQVMREKAVVIKDETPSRFEPLVYATTFFTLYEGEAVRVTASNGEWFKIRRSDGKQGWVKKPDIEMI